MQGKTPRYLTYLITGSLFMSAAVPRAIALPTSERLARPSVPGLSAQVSPENQRSLPKVVTRRVKQEIVKSYKIPANQLRITAAQTRTWDGCLGLPDPLALCTQIAISGWQVMVEAPQHRWVYHTTANGAQVRLNEAASLIRQRSPLSIQFLPQDEIVATPEEDVLFKSVDQGGITGQTVITKLTKEGIISRQRVAPNIRSRPVVVKRLTPQQVEAFLEQVQQTRFNHLMGLRYLPSRPGADLITTQINLGNAVVEYVDSTQAQLPPALQQVIEAWQNVLRS